MTIPSVAAKSPLRILVAGVIATSGKVLLNTKSLVEKETVIWSYMMPYAEAMIYISKKLSIAAPTTIRTTTGKLTV